MRKSKKKKMFHSFLKVYIPEDFAEDLQMFKGICRNNDIAPSLLIRDWIKKYIKYYTEKNKENVETNAGSEENRTD